jgi:isochorismate hydrolase
VASTLRDAHVRNFHNIVLSDGYAAFSHTAHDSTISSLSTSAQVATCDDIISELRPARP